MFSDDFLSFLLFFPGGFPWDLKRSEAFASQEEDYAEEDEEEDSSDESSEISPVEADGADGWRELRWSDSWVVLSLWGLVD